MGEELECHNLEIPISRNKQIWSRIDLGLERDRFYATFYAIQELQRQQQAGLPPTNSETDRNLLILFAFNRNKSGLGDE